MRHANLPFHLYVNVSNDALGPNMPDGVTAGVWWGIHCRPGQALMCHVLLESGAQWAGIPVHHVSVSKRFDRGHHDLMPWAAMGERIEAFHGEYLEGVGVGVRRPFDSEGRHTGIIVDWADGFSRYPHEHKPLNLIELKHGQFALLPNNFIEFDDRHLVKQAKRDDLRLYRRNDVVHWGH
jgi:hypothetical protein